MLSLLSFAAADIPYKPEIHTTAIDLFLPSCNMASEFLNANAGCTLLLTEPHLLVGSASLQLVESFWNPDFVLCFQSSYLDLPYLLI